MPKRERDFKKPISLPVDPNDDNDDRKPAAQPLIPTSVSASSAPVAAAGQAVDEVDSCRDDSVLNRVTPHMERLLRLIQEGTTESAQMAAGQLTQLTRQSSAIVLWQVLGKLQAIIMQQHQSSSWKARENAAMAMQGVAGNLPVTDQKDFFRQPHNVDGEKDDAEQHQHRSSLRLADIDVSALLTQGQELYAVAPSKVAEEQEEGQEMALDQLDSQASDFVQTRIQAQRKILAERLGFASIQEALTLTTSKQSNNNKFHALGDIVSNEDILATYQPNIKKKKRPRGKDDDSEGREYGIQHLLVREMSKASQGTSAASHRAPQNLLANELVYRMFDSVWQRRHGGFLGILALLKAWRKTVWLMESNENEGTLFGPWPEDILARSICLLSLDRFGDFSGASPDVAAPKEMTQTRQNSSGVVAPIRELAAQLVSLLWKMAPAVLQQQTMYLLVKILETTADWETRHGILKALKFITIVIVLDKDVQIKSGEKQKWFQDCLDLCGTIAGQFLRNANQDVAGAAAQILCEYPSIALSKSTILHEVWKAVQSLDVVASNVNDMVSLLSSCVQNDARECVGRLAALEKINPDSFSIQLVGLFCRFVDCPFASVKIAALRSLCFLANADTKKGAARLFDQETSAYCDIMKRLFTCYIIMMKERALLAEDRTNEDGLVMLQLNQTWDAFCSLLSDEDDAPVQVLTSLMFQILELFFYPDEQMSQSTMWYLMMGPPCTAVAALVSKVLATVDIRDLLISTIKIFLKSPWVVHCEMACTLARLLAQRGEGKFHLAPIFPLFSEMLETMPLCLQIRSTGGDTVFGRDMILKHKQRFRENLISTETQDDLNGFRQDEILQQSTLAGSGLNKGMNRYDSTITQSMRLKASIAAAALRVGTPSKITLFVRALMTSIKSETSNFRLSVTSSALSHFLVNSHVVESWTGARKKIVKSLSELITELQSRRLPCANYASKAIGGYLECLPRETLVSTVCDLENLSILQNIDVASTEKVEKCLIFVKSLLAEIDSKACMMFIAENYIGALCRLSCHADMESNRDIARAALLDICVRGSDKELAYAFLFAVRLIDSERTKEDVLHAILLIKDLCGVSPALLGRFVKFLLPIVLRTMTDSDRRISDVASCIFATLVRVAPLVSSDSGEFKSDDDKEPHISAVVDHLIRGKPLPIMTLPRVIACGLEHAGVKLRDYQLEGISWISFLTTVNLNGALCDSMGLGKTIQALVGIALAHERHGHASKSIVVCPATIVNHWVGEVRRFFPDNRIFRPFAVVGNTSTRKQFWSVFSDSQYNLVVVSYGTLRNDIDEIARTRWVFCVLDEGHVLRNPKTATARASRRVPSRHRMILSGTMIQNRVLDIWATFDFLMPNFLGSAREFSKTFASPITRSQLPGADADCIHEGMEKLRLLHQQVLPFILRREKEQVLRELPAKHVTDLVCNLSTIQRRLYDAFASSREAKDSIALLESNDYSADGQIGSKILRILIFLRLICTHPSLLEMRHDNENAFRGEQSKYTLSSSGKFLALFNLLRDCGVNTDDLMAGDNDESAFANDDAGVNCHTDSDGRSLRGLESPLASIVPPGERGCKTKCLIFAQFAQSLDAIEEYLFKPHMPSLRYLRLDGSVPSELRVGVANRFNTDSSISVLLLTTRVGSLGLNLSGASIVIFVEHDFNPFVDEQAMDRVHRIGQRAASVNIYRLVAFDSIDEKIMVMQRKKIAMSKAVVNTENSTLYSMGTDRLLDIFTPSSSAEDATPQDLDAILSRFAQDYEGLSVDEFIRNFQKGSL